jgi:dethiobiotin synthase
MRLWEQRVKENKQMGKKNRGFFITGTGTDVGKTYVCRLLAQAFSEKIAVSYMKPVQTGCRKIYNNNLASQDYDYVKRSGVLVTGDEELHVPYRFGPACSPHLAAKLARKKISLSHIRACLKKIRMPAGIKNGCLLVEGAGGVLAPLGGSESMIHLIMCLKLPVILVTLPSLGTLNHTFLTLCALHSAGIPLAGVVMNNGKNCPRDFIYRDNVKTIQRYIGAVPFLEVGHKATIERKVRVYCNELAKKHF